ncbi:MAG: DUF5596 domain-containing protein [Clostridia bacterium]|nr:DUF5596 domain-containing protein [Clostridia bacterium]
MRKYLEDFMQECDYNKDDIYELLSAYDKLHFSCSDELSALVSEYDAGYNIDYESALEGMKELSRLAGIHEYTGALLLFLCYTGRLREYYKEAGISDEIFLVSVLDLKYKLDECKCVYGIKGSFVAKWFSGFFNLTRFALGRLQFEIVDFGGEYEKGGVKLTPDTKVINVHIPRTGTRLDRESTLESYRLAKDFFAPKFAETIAFVCSSWLLFPRHRQMLKPDSNLLAFMNDYDLVALGEYENYNEVWRLFDTNYDGDVSHLPADSSLRRAYIDLVSRGEKTGWGKGVFVYMQ